MNKVLAVLLLATTFNIAAAAPSLGRYDKKSRGFYLGHFDQSPDTNANFIKFGGLVYRGGQPNFQNGSMWLNQLKAEGIDLVIDLRSEARGLTTERNGLKAAGIDYILLPWKTSGTDQDAIIEVAEIFHTDGGVSENKTKFPKIEASIRVIRTVQTYMSKGLKVYIHCQRGEDRTGTFISLLRHRNDAWKKEFNAYGGVLYAPLKKHREDLLTHLE